MLWGFGSASGTCPSNCSPSAPAGSSFSAKAVQDQFSGFTGWTGNCGTDGLDCNTPSVAANSTVTATFQAQAGSPTVTSLSTFAATDTYGPTMILNTDGDAGFLMAGKTSGSVNFGVGAVNGAGYLAAFNDPGTLRWAKHLPNTGQIEIFDVAAAPDFIVVGGRCTSSANFADAGTALPDGPCVARLDGAGTLQWSKGWVGTGSVSRVAVSGTGMVAVAGVVAGAFNLGTGALTDHGGDDFFFGLLDATGTTVMARRGGKGYGDAPGGVAFAPNGDVLFGAQIYGGPATFETIQLTQANFQTASLIARYSPAGVFLTGRALNGQVLSDDLLVSPAGDVYFVGEYSNTVDFGGVSLYAGAGLTSNGVVVKYNPALQAQWANDGYSSLVRGAVAPDGSVALLGSYYRYADWGGGYLTSYGIGPANSTSSGLLVRTDPSGNIAWSKRVATNARGLAISASRLWVAGFGTVVVGAGTTPPAPYLVSFPR